jgi:SAM-dependent methyltransferase
MMTQESPEIPGVGRKQDYALGRSSTESKRLSDQHEVLLKAAGGYIPVPLSIQCEMLEAILDVGTGNGAWLLGLRQSGIIPNSVELVGVDVSDKMMPSIELGRKFGLNLQVKDLCEPLPSSWNGKFDYIHGRHVFIWIEPYKWLDVMCNLKRALKPGGTLVVSYDLSYESLSDDHLFSSSSCSTSQSLRQIMYPGEVPYDHKTEKPMGTDTAPSRLFSAFLQ